MPHGKTHNKGDLNKDGKMSGYETRRSNDTPLILASFEPLA